MAITGEQRLQVARWLRAPELPAGARGQLEVLRRWHEPAPADRQAIDRALGYGSGPNFHPPMGPVAAGAAGAAEAAARFPQAVSVDDAAAFWAAVYDADVTYERRAWLEQQCPGSTAGLPVPPDPAA